ncbi:MAG: peptidylprolyl isomerase [Saprospiraceae bacterium]|nr:peptidylprolyl isomerase [Saprospiraceae bacterium]
MNRLTTLLLFGIFSLVLSSCAKEKNTYAVIETGFGNMKVMLYNTTPKHRDNFIKLAKEGYYDSLLFHRVISAFMIQGGDPDSRNAPPGAPLGMGGPGYQLDAEIGAPHLRGALAAARNNNPQKMSSGSQFYLVQGQKIDDNYLDETERRQNIRYSPEQRKLYKEIGGTPFLDNDYTVFGEIVEGLDVLDKIAAVPTDASNRPLEDVRMKVRILE